MGMKLKERKTNKQFSSKIFYCFASMVFSFILKDWKRKVKFQNSSVSLCLYQFYGILCAMKIKEFLVLEFDKGRTGNKERLVLGLEI